MRTRKTIRKKITDFLDLDGKICCYCCQSKFFYKCGIFTKHLKIHHGMSIREYYLRFVDGEDCLCLCGCGEMTNWESRGGFFIDYVNGHNFRGKTKETDECVRVRSEKTRKNPNHQRTLFKKGHISWNEGLTKESDEKMRLSSERSSKTRKEWSSEKRLSIFKKISETARRNFSLGVRTSSFADMTDEQRKIMSKKSQMTKLKKYHSVFPFISGWHISSLTGEKVFYQSSWEKERMEFYDRNDDIISWSRCKDVIEFYDSASGIVRFYNPDFVVKFRNGLMRVEEVKGCIDQNVIDKAISAKIFYESIGYEYIVLTKMKRCDKLFEISVEDMEKKKVDSFYW